ncbi:MAG: CAP domain-containing protein [Gammaproteobacteria bacterium]|nr:CAP domain-containing protein [Gammaproteobacteria bacterium]
MLRIYFINILSGVILLNLCCFKIALAATVIDTNNSADNKIKALTALNKIRRQVNLKPFSPNTLLIQSAKNHADYSTQNNFPAGHIETDSSRKEFTGKTPVQRTSFAGYASLFVAENVSSGQDSYEASISGLMSAIYHRFAFLNPLYDEVGMAKSTYPNGKEFYAYNLGNRSYNDLCQEPSYMGFDSFYLKVCQPNIKIEASGFNQIKQGYLSFVPELIVWPTDNAHSISPVFYEEDPDPLPDLSVAGYPISIEVNPLKLKDFKMSSFLLYREDTGEQIKQTRLLTKDTDPNEKLTAYQYALFPLLRLENDAFYRVFIKFKANNKEMSRSWSFKTSPLSVDKHTYTVQPGQKQLMVSSGLKEFVLYFPPSTEFPSFNRFQAKYNLLIKPDIKFIDKNTLNIKLNGLGESQLRLLLNDGREFTILLVDQGKVNKFNVNSIPRINKVPIYDSASDLLSMPFVRENNELYQYYLKLVNRTENKISFKLVKAIKLSSDIEKNIIERNFDLSGKGLLDSLSINGKIFPYVLLTKDTEQGMNVFTFNKQ